MADTNDEGLPVRIGVFRCHSRIDEFITEIEVEHVKEVYVEQAFLNYRVNDWLNIRGGLMLIPMGIVNELHEPPTFNGVERPALDYYIVPTTWREIGLGFNGRIDAAKLKYQLYLVNGFISYDGGARLNGNKALRGEMTDINDTEVGCFNISGIMIPHVTADIRLGA